MIKSVVLRYLGSVKNIVEGEKEDTEGLWILLATLIKKIEWRGAMLVVRWIK